MLHQQHASSIRIYKNSDIDGLQKGTNPTPGSHFLRDTALKDEVMDNVSSKKGTRVLEKLEFGAQPSIHDASNNPQDRHILHC